MRGISLLNFKSVMNLAVVALAAMILVPSCGAAPAGAQLGPVWTGGSLTSGGTLSYQLSLTVTSPDVLISKASIKGKRWKANFPILTNSPVVGVTTVDQRPAGAITIPSNFTGTAVLRIRPRYGRRAIGNKVHFGHHHGASVNAARAADDLVRCRV